MHRYLVGQRNSVPCNTYPKADAPLAADTMPLVRVHVRYFRGERFLADEARFGDRWRTAPARVARLRPSSKCRFRSQWCRPTEHHLGDDPPTRPKRLWGGVRVHQLWGTE